MFSLAVSLLFSCKTDVDDAPAIELRESAPAPVNENTISTDFSDNFFSNKGEIELLKELNLCNPNAANDTDEKLSACSPKFFRFFELNKSIPLKDGFMVLVKAEVGGFPLRRLLIFQRENGSLVKVNGFAGNLIERRPAASGFDDLVIRFGKREDDGNMYFYNCLFSWNEGKYEYRFCEAINDSRVKKEYVDSMAPEIKSLIDKNRFIF